MDIGHCCKMKSTDCKHWRCGSAHGEDGKISWKDGISKDELFTMMNDERCLIRTITQRNSDN